MKRSVVTTWILLGLLALLVGWYSLYEKRLRPEREQKAEQAKNLVTLDSAAVTELEIIKKADKGKAAPTLKLKKEGNDWKLTTPVSDAADSTTVTSLLGTLTSIKQDRVVDSAPKDLEPYGLKEPYLTIRAKKKDGALQEIQVGSDTPVGFNVYAKLASSPSVYRVSKSVKTSFDKSAFDLRNKNIVGVARTQVEEVEINKPAERVVLNKKDDKWWLASEGLPADGGEVAKTLTSLLDLRATGFPEENTKNPAAYGLSKPEIRVQITYREGSKDKGKRLGLWIGKAKDKFYAKRTDRATIFEIAGSAISNLERKPAAYEDRKLTEVGRFEIAKLTLAPAGGSPLELTKEKEGWVQGPKKEKVDQGTVESWLSALEDTKISAFDPTQKPAAYGLSQPALSIHIFKKDAKEPAGVLAFGKETKGRVPLLKVNTVAFIAASDFKKLNIGRKDLEPKPEKPRGKNEAKK